MFNTKTIQVLLQLRNFVILNLIFCLKIVLKEKIFKELYNVNINKATKNTDIPTKIIKENSDIFGDSIFSNLNCCINTSSYPHSHKKRKDSLETRAVLLIFSFELEMSGVAVQSTHQNSKKLATFAWNCSVKWLWRCFSHFLLLWQWYQDFWGSSEDRYRSKRVSQMLLVCYNLLNSQNIAIYQSMTVKNGWLQEYLRRS